jgi:WD40 repeat protein
MLDLRPAQRITLRSVLGHADRVDRDDDDGGAAIALSPDGTMIAVAHENDPVYIWNIATRRVVATITAAAGAPGVAFSPDGKTLAVSITDSLDQNNNYLAPGIELWDVATRHVTAKSATGHWRSAGRRDTGHSR